MATQRKEHGPGRDRRGISPSDPRPTNKRSPGSPSPTAPASAQKTVSTPSEKRIPNYLKPTISSTLDPSAHGAKQALKTAAAGGGQKPNNISRRRSLDHKAAPPPSSLHKQHASVNPLERNLRSLQNTTSMPKPRLREGSSKAPVDARKFRPVCTGGADRTADKKMATSKKEEKCVASTTRVSSASSLPELTDIPVVEGRHEDQESSVTDVEDEVVNVGSSNEFLAETSMAEEYKDQNEDVKESQSHLRSWDRFSSSVADLNPVEPLPVLGDQTESQDVVGMEEEPEEKVLVEETNSNNNQKGKEEQGKDIESNNQPDETHESSSGKPEVEEEEDDEGAHGETENPGAKPTLDEKEEEEEDHVDEKNLAAATSSTEKEAEDSGTEAKPAEVENAPVKVAAPAREGGGQGKKDSQAYNDVIEETASKLLEKRKNKVRALVGAFETVISLQEPET